MHVCVLESIGATRPPPPTAAPTCKTGTANGRRPRAH